ncbi:MAG: hypothetical protein ACREBC_17210 [Pyrinomonadaceae bacterium]
MKFELLSALRPSSATAPPAAQLFTLLLKLFPLLRAEHFLKLMVSNRGGGKPTFLTFETFKLE